MKALWRITVGVCMVASLTLLSYCSFNMSSLRETVNLAIQARPQMQTLTNSWQSEGMTVNVTTPYDSPETAEEHVARHVEKVRLMKIAFPIDD